MTSRRTVPLVTASAVAAMIVAGCTSGSHGNTSPPTVISSVTVSSTASASSSAPLTGSGAPASTPPATTPPATTPPAGTTAPASGPGLCTPTVARFTVTPGDGASEHFAFAVQVVNASSTPCVTTGYPGVALLDASGRQVEQASRTPAGYFGGLQPGSSPARIVLQPGQVATALIEGNDVDPTTGDPSCGSSQRLLFTLPDNTDSTTLRHTEATCAGLQVHPLIAGSSGRQPG